MRREQNSQREAVRRHSYQSNHMFPKNHRPLSLKTSFWLRKKMTLMTIRMIKRKKSE